MGEKGLERVGAGSERVQRDNDRHGRQQERNQVETYESLHFM